MERHEQLTHKVLGTAWDQVARYVPWPRFDRAEYKPAIDGVIRGLTASIENDASWFDFLEIWKVVNQYSALDIYRAKTIYDLFIESKEVEGDIYEFGSYMGGTGILLGLLVKKLGLPKQVHLYDSFQGLPSLANDEQAIQEYWEGAFVGNKTIVMDQISRNGLQEHVQIHEGWFEETLKDFSKPVSFAHFDADIYSSTKFALDAIGACLSPHAMLVFDDYFDLTQGVRRAVEESAIQSEEVYLAPLPMAFVEHSGHLSSDHSIVIEDKRYATSYLLRQTHWLKYFTDLIQKVEQETTCMRRLKDSLSRFDASTQ